MLIILDRDGVINLESEHYIKTPDEWTALPGSLEAIAILTQAGHTLVVATNQSGIGRGYYTEATLQHIHDKLLTQVTQHGGHIAKIYYCPHHPDDCCECRKPKPGMLLKIAEDFQSDLKHAIFVGDSRRDLEAAHTVGCPAALVCTGYGEKTLRDNPGLASQVAVYDDLLAFAHQMKEHS